MRTLDLLVCGFIYFGFDNERSVVVVSLCFERGGRVGLGDYILGRLSELN